MRSLQSDQEFLGEGALGEIFGFSCCFVDCAAPDDLNTAIGADDDPNVVAAVCNLNTGAARWLPHPVDGSRPRPLLTWNNPTGAGRRIVNTSTFIEPCRSMAPGYPTPVSAMLLKPR